MQDLARTSVLAPALSPRYLGELWQEVHSESLNKCFLKDDVEADANWSRLLLTKALVSPNQVSSWMVGNPYLTDYGRVARHSGIIPRSPPVGREGDHFNVVARRGRHWAVHQPLARSQHGIAWTPLTAPIWPVSQGSS